MAADGMEVSAGGGGGGGNKQPQISMVGLFLACMVAGGVQYGWALQLSLLTPYVQVCMQTYIYVCVASG
jgi:solute carrier family 45 protein 1/2/4